MTAPPELAGVCQSRRMDNTGLIAAAVVLLLGSAFGVWRRRTDGTLRAVSVVPEAPVAATAVATSLLTAPDQAASVQAASVQAPSDQAVSGQATPVQATAEAGSPIDAGLLAGLGVRPAAATLLQFSSAFCAPCRAVRRISAEVAAMVPQVQHVEVDAESHLDAVRALDVWRTPTLLVLDADGRVVKRATGVPSKAQLIAVLGEILPPST